MLNYDKREDYFCQSTELIPIRRLAWDVMVSWRNIFNADTNYPVIIAGPLNEAHGMTCILKYAPDDKKPMELMKGRVIIDTFKQKEFERHIHIYYLCERFPRAWYWEVIRELKWDLFRKLDLQLIGEYA